VAQEAPQQAPAGESRVCRVAGAQAGPGRALAPCDRLAGLCGTDVGRAGCDVRHCQPGWPARHGSAAALAPADALRGPRPAPGPRSLGPAVRQDAGRLTPTMDTALTLTTDMKLVLGLAGFTMAMFPFERIRADVVALVVLVLLGLTGLVAPEDLFNGFSGNAVISIIATMILGAGLDRTGALNRLAGWLLRRAHGVEQRLLLLTSAVAGLNSSIMQNPSVMALYLPVASRLTSRTGIPLSRILLPVAISIVMGGGLTMVGNSPLILLNDLLVSANANLPSGVATLEPLRMFAPMPIGLALLGASLLYFHFFGDRLLREESDK